MSGVPSFERFLAAALIDNNSLLGLMMENNALRISSARWTNDQRIEFLKRCIHEIPRTEFYTGSDPYVMRMAAMRGACYPPSGSTITNHHLCSFLRLLSSINLGTDWIPVRASYDLMKSIMAHGPQNSPLRVSFIWYDL